MKKEIWIDLILLVFLPIIIGGIIYILFRAEEMIMFEWFRVLSIEDSIDILRNNLTWNIPDWILYNLPDGLWLFSITSLMIIIWRQEINISKLVYILFPSLFVLLWEFGQYLNVIKGIFDIKDLVIYLIATFFALIKIKGKLFQLIIKTS